MPSLKGFTRGVKNAAQGYGSVLKANTAIQRTASDLYKFNKNIKQVAEINAKGGGERISKQAKKVFEDIRAVDPEFEKAVSGISKKDLNHANEVQKYYEQNKKVINKRANNYRDAASNISGQKLKDGFATYRDSVGYNNDFKGNVKAGLDVAGTYFFGEGGKKSAIRIGTAAAGYMGVNMAGRAITGGSLTTNNNGERDIAGIPFI
jgi:hypothetical protein